MMIKKTIQYLLLSVFSFFSLVSIAQPGETGQRLEISQGGLVLDVFYANGNSTRTNAPETLSINNAFPLGFRSLDGVPRTIATRSCVGVMNGDCGWYKAFWIFGDGNYYKPENYDTELDVPTLFVGNYRYAQPGLYQPVVYLTEKYHNTKPPEAARAVIQVSTTGASGTYVERTKILENVPDRNVFIDYNHTPRVDYPINLVLSYRRNQGARALLLYYNSLANQAHSNFIPTQLFTFLTNEATNYQGLGYKPGVEEDIVNEEGLRENYGKLGMNGSGNILDSLKAKFKSRLIYDFSQLSAGLPQELTELRVFPVLQTETMQSIPSQLFTEFPTTQFPCFAAILVGQDSVASTNVAYTRLMQQAQKLFGQINSLRLGPNNNNYIQGIELLNLKLQTSHDPNSLVVDNIQPLDNGKFNVLFRLTICNQGEVTESNPSLEFHDLTGGKFSAKPELRDIGTAIPTWEGGTAGLPWRVSLAGFNVPGTPNSSVPSCRELFFTMETDAQGVKKLYLDVPRAMEVCVDFSAGVGECSKNDVLEEVPPAEQCDMRLCYMILSILLIILLWYFLRGIRL